MNTEESKWAPDIRIGTIARDASPSFIRQVLPHGFESFSLTFWQSCEGVNFRKLAREVRETLGDSGAVISSLCLYGNPLESGEADKQTLKGLRKCIDNAHLFGCDIVGGFTGRIRGKSIDECIGAFKRVWAPLSRRAADKGVRIAFENCRMRGTWQSGDWNIAHNPTAWAMMFDAVPADNLGLQWEPCHQMVALIDPVPQLKEWAPRVFHVHGKDASIHWDVVRKHGVFSEMSAGADLPYGIAVPPFAYHRTPGFGDCNWSDIITILRQSGFRGSIDIEGWHDPVMKGELEMTGQVSALRYLKACRGEFVPNPR